MSTWTKNSATITQDNGFTFIYTPENIISVPGGGVRIKANELTDMSWKCGAIDTSESFSFLFGYIEARMKLTLGKGLDRAFFLFNSQQEEIDFEIIDPDTKSIHLAVHDALNANSTYLTYNSNVNLSEDYHLYGISWSSNYVKWYLDKKLIYRQHLYVPQLPLSPYFAVSAGGSWTGNPDATTPNPAYMDISWVKFWQKIN